MSVHWQGAGAPPPAASCKQVDLFQACCQSRRQNRKGAGENTSTLPFQTDVTLTNTSLSACFTGNHTSSGVKSLIIGLKVSHSRLTAE